MIEALYTILASKYRVGYHPEKDELFLYTVSEDGLCTVFDRGQLDAMFFEEFMSDAEWFDLGEYEKRLYRRRNIRLLR